MINIMNIGLSGMQTYQRGLSNVGNNLANLNTPGYKRLGLLYSDIFYQYQPRNNHQYIKGNGAKIGGSTVNFSQGALQSSTNNLDLAINGQGFFIAKKNNQHHFTRVGQFEIDRESFLVCKGNGARVQALKNKQLIDFSIKEHQYQLASPTKKITLSGNLSTGTKTTSIETSAYDEDGVQRKLKIIFSNDSSNKKDTWQVEVQEVGSEASIVGSGEVRFSANGTPVPGFNEVNVFLKSASGKNGQVTFDFGIPGTLSGVTQLSGGGDSTINAANVDGYAAGSFMQLNFDDSGTGSITYSNGQKKQIDALALAWFSLPDKQLTRIGDGFYTELSEHTAIIGQANSKYCGKVVSKQLEMSNVELSAEFSEMMITQRGYQSASQLISAANEMMQQALQMRSGR